MLRQRYNLTFQRDINTSTTGISLILEIIFYNGRLQYGFPTSPVISNIIMKDLIRLMDPKYIEVTGIFTPRGGISIYPYCNYGRPGTKYEEMASYRLMNRK